MIPIHGIDLLLLQDSLRLSKDKKGLSQVFDPLRKKLIRVTPEEIVRQLWIHYFLTSGHWNPKLMAVERAFDFNGMSRRFDLVLFDNSTHPFLLAEFKGPAIPITQTSFDQIARYNMKLNVPYSLVSNGYQHYCFQIDDIKREFTWLEQLPINI